ncbi:MAG: hypothetical protein R3D03_15245 [Geminicoccaceae bacterium]
MVEETIDATTLISGKTARKDFPSLVLDSSHNSLSVTPGRFSSV